MKHSYLEVTYRKGRALAAYYYLPRRDGDRSIRTERVGGGLLVDFTSDGRAIGIEISPVHCLIARLRALLAGTWPQVSVRWGDIYRADLTDADVIFWYGYSRYDGRLKAHLERQLRDGARIVSINVDLPGWQPECVDKHDLIFLYRMPPPAGDLTSYLMQQAT